MTFYIRLLTKRHNPTFPTSYSRHFISQPCYYLLYSIKLEDLPEKKYLYIIIPFLHCSWIKGEWYQTSHLRINTILQDKIVLQIKRLCHLEMQILLQLWEDRFEIKSQHCSLLITSHFIFYLISLGKVRKLLWMRDLLLQHLIWEDDTHLTEIT